MSELKIKILSGIVTSAGTKFAGEVVSLPEPEALYYVIGNRAVICDDEELVAETTETKESPEEQPKKKKGA